MRHAKHNAQAVCAAVLSDPSRRQVIFSGLWQQPEHFMGAGQGVLKVSFQGGAGTSWLRAWEK